MRPDDRRRVLRAVKYLWASPATAIGVLFALPALCTGAQARVVDGIVEVHGGALSRFAARLPFVAITLGHVVLARDPGVALAYRAHEQVHVRQYERLGPLFLPLYAAASAAAWLRGGRPYVDNVFEREARGELRLPWPHPPRRPT